MFFMMLEAFVNHGSADDDRRGGEECLSYRKSHETSLKKNNNNNCTKIAGTWLAWKTKIS